jgi:hypothetical protein
LCKKYSCKLNDFKGNKYFVITIHFVSLLPKLNFMLHLPRFWKHKETKEVIDHLTYSDLKGKPESSNFDECDVTGELLNQPEAVAEPAQSEVTNENPAVVNNEPFVENEPEVTTENTVVPEVKAEVENGNENNEARATEEATEEKVEEPAS